MYNKPVIVFEGIEGSGKTLHINLVSNYLKKKRIDHIKIRDQEFIIRPPMTDKHILLNSMVSGPSKSDLFVYKVSACFKLYGTAAVSKGSSVVTTTIDQRKVLSVGDVVEIGSEQFEVVALLDANTFSISREWENINLVAADLYKCPSAVNYGEELPGRCNVVKGSRVVRTSSDMTNFISPSDIIPTDHILPHDDIVPNEVTCIGASPYLVTGRGDCASADLFHT